MHATLKVAGRIGASRQITPVTAAKRVDKLSRLE
jgi:hypothetical protein